MPIAGRLLLATLLLLADAASSAAAAPIPVADTATISGTEETGVLEPPIIDVPASPRRTHWYGLASVGFAYRWAFDQSMIGAALNGELGAHSNLLAGGVRLHIEAGRMLAGLPYQVVTFGPVMWVRVHERVRVGAGLDAGALLLGRRTVPGRSMWTVMLGGHIGGSVDLLHVGPSGALQLDTTVGAYALTTAPGPVSMVTTLALGYRP